VSIVEEDFAVLRADRRALAAHRTVRGTADHETRAVDHDLQTFTVTFFILEFAV